MPETETNPGKPHRFPYVAAFLCAACVGGAVWTWMRYSYVWDTDTTALNQPLRGRHTTHADGAWPDDAYVSFSGKVFGFSRGKGTSIVYVRDGDEFVNVTMWNADIPPTGSEVAVFGRVNPLLHEPVRTSGVDATASLGAFRPT